MIFKEKFVCSLPKVFRSYNSGEACKLKKLYIVLNKILKFGLRNYLLWFHHQDFILVIMTLPCFFIG